MNESSIDPSASASKPMQGSLRVVAQALAATSLEALAAAIAKDDSTASRIRSEEAKVSISDAVRLICAAGLKVVPTDRVCVERATYEALATIASKAMSNTAISRQLVWDGEQ